MLGAKHNLAQLREQFVANRFLVVDDFLEPAVAQSWRDYTLKRQGWFLSGHRGDGFERLFWELRGNHAGPPVQWFRDAAFGAFLKTVTDMGLTDASSSSAFRYASGHGLGVHLDQKPEYRLSFVYHLSQDWQESWGGLFEDHRDPEHVKTTCPKFNRLVLLDTSTAPFPHAVSTITPEAQGERLTITGYWR